MSEVLDQVLLNEVRRTVTEVGTRLSDPARRAQAVRSMRVQTAFPTVNRWNSASLPLGGAGIAVALNGVTGHPAVPHDLIAEGARALRTIPGSHLFGGLAGYAAAVELVAGSRGYATLRGQLSTSMVRRIAVSIESVSTNPDLITGLAGWDAYLAVCRRSNEVTAARAAVRHATVRLFESEDLVSVFAQQVETGEQVELAPHGYVPLGLAHGVAGSVASLALQAVEDGLGSDSFRLRRALRKGAAWLLAQAVDDDGYVAWPRCLLLRDRDGAAVPGDLARPGWCYGTPGVARALWLAGSVLDEQQMRDAALDALLGALRPERIEELKSPTLCHGLAGLLIVVAQFVQEVELSALRNACRGLVERLVAAYEPESLLGFQDVEVGGARVDNPGLLSGAAGVLAALTIAAGHGSRLPRLLLVA